MNRAYTTFRRICNLIAGTAPWRTASFESIALERLAPHRRIHRPEDFTGIVAEFRLPSHFHREGTPLLSQQPTWETVSDKPRYRSSGVAPEQTLRLYSMTRAGVISASGIVYCSDTRTAVAETVRDWFKDALDNPVLGAVGHPSARMLQGTTLSLLTLGGEGFYHFFLEALPRLQAARPHLANVDWILVNGRPGSFHESWLKHAGVPADRIVWMEGLCHVICEQLLFTDSPMRDQLPTAWHIEAVRGLFPPPDQVVRTGSRRIWISRRDAASRRPVWEAELLNQMPDFKAVSLGKLTPEQQIKELSSAEVVAGPHGAGLAQIVFCPRGTKVVEIFPTQLRQPIYGRLATLSGLPHAWAVVDFDGRDGLSTLTASMRSFCEA